MDEDKPTGLTQRSTKTCRQLRKDGSGRGGLPQGRAHQSAARCQTVSPGNTTNTIWTETYKQVILRKGEIL